MENLNLFSVNRDATHPERTVPEIETTNELPGESMNMVATPNGNSPVGKLASPWKSNDLLATATAREVSGQIAEHIVSARQTSNNGEMELEIALDPPDSCFVISSHAVTDRVIAGGW